MTEKEVLRSEKDWRKQVIEAEGRGRREGAGRAQSAEASSAGRSLRRRAEVGGGRSGEAATHLCVATVEKKTQGVGWLLFFVMVTVSVACCFSRLAA